MSSGTYLYCVVRSARTPPAARAPGGVPGADQAAAHKLGGAIWLVTTHVPLDQYGPGALERSLRDLDWVGRVAIAHEGVVEHFSRSRGATVAPLKLFTLFSSVDRALASMGRRRSELERVLDRVEGCEEWGVRITRRSPPPPGRRGTARPASGAAFLAARKRARDDARSAILAAATAADAAYASLSKIARERRRHTSDGTEVAAPLLDAAFLVPARKRQRFHAAAARLAGELARSGGQMTVTGPWPPYNFVALEKAS